MSGAIVPVSAAHAEALALVHGACFGPEGWSAASFAELLRSRLVFGFISLDGALALGRAVADEAELLTLGVVARARRRGIGGALLGMVVAEASARGAATLFLEVAADNEPARALYRAAGFVEGGRRADYYGPGADALLLRRRLCE